MTASPATLRNRLRDGIFMHLTYPVVLFTVDFLLTLARSGVGGYIGAGGTLFFILAALGHAAVFSLLVFLCVYLPASLVFRRGNVAATLSTVVLIVVQTLLILNIFVFSLYRFHLNGFIFNLAIGGGAEVFEFDRDTYLKFALLVLGGAVIPMSAGQYLCARYFRQPGRRTFRCVVLTLSCCLVASQIIHVVAAANRDPFVRKASTVLPYFYPLTANKLLVKWGWADPDKFSGEQFNLFGTDIIYPLEAPQYDGQIPEYNIVHILIDSWNPSAFDSITTPKIYGFSHKGATFHDHHSSSNGTQGSIFGIFFGLSFTYEKEFSISKMSPLWIDRMIECGYDINVFPSATFRRPPFHEMIFRRVPGIRTVSEGSTAYDRDRYITTEFNSFLSSGTPPPSVLCAVIL